MNYEYTENPEIGKKLEMAMRAVSDNVSGIEGMLNSLLGMIGAFISVAVYSCFIIAYKWWFFLFLAILSFAGMLAHLKQKNYERSRAEELAECNRKKTYFYNVMGDFKNGKDIRLYGLNQYLENKYTDAGNAGLEIQKDILSVRGFGMTAESILKAFKMLGIYLLLFLSYRNGEITIGQFSFYFSAMTTWDILVQQFLRLFVEIKAQSVFIDDFRNFLELNEYAECDPDHKISIEEIVKIEFEHVDFSYPGNQSCILRDVNFTISKGERIALVGLNGAGKTTLIKLLCGFYTPTKGTIKVNDIDIHDVDKKSYVNCISALFQDYQFFSFSIGENVAASESGDADKMRRIFEKLRLDTMIDKLSKGIHTTIYRVLDKDGIELSGGQSQRVAFARALYKNSSLMLLDEPTAALDVVAETNLYKDFNDLTSDKMVIFISHRLASTKFCDRIITLYDGHIDEDGSHDELMKNAGRYAELYRLQSSRYLSE